MKLFRNIPLKGLVGGLAFVFALVAVQMTNVQFAAAATKTWTGAGADTKFSTTANWSGGVAPVTGDSLVFPTVAGGPFTMVNDLNGSTTFVGVDVTGTTSYTVDSVTLSAGAVNVTGGVNFGITAGLHSNSTLTLNGNSHLNIAALTSVGDVTVSSAFSATSANLTTTIAAMSSAFTVTGTLQVGGALTVTQAFTAGALDVGTNLAANSAFTVTNGITVGGNLTMSGAPAITTAGPVAVTGDATFSGTFVGTPNLSVSGNAAISSALIAGAVDVTGTLTVGGSFAATSTSVGAFVINSSFNGGAIVSYADLTTGVHTVTATTLSFPNGSLLTVSSGGSVVASTSITVGDANADATAKIVAGAGSTIDTPSITVYGDVSNVSTLGGTLSGTPSISLPNGSLTLSSASSVGVVTVANVLTASNFTATTVNTDTIVISAPFTVSGTLNVNSTSATLTVASNINVVTLHVVKNLTITSAFTVTTVNVGDTLTVNNTSFSATTVTAGTLVMTTSFNVSGTLTVAGALTVSQPLTVGTLVAQGGLTISNASGVFTASTAVNVTGNLTASEDYSAPIVNVSGNATLTSWQSTSHSYVISGNLYVGTSTLFSQVYVATGTNVTGIVTVEDSSYLYQDDLAIADFGSLVVKNGGTVKLYGTVTYPVTFGSGKSISSPSVGYNSYMTTLDANNKPIYNTLKFTGAVTLLNDLQVRIYGNATSGSIEFAGTLNKNAFSIWKQNGTSGILVIGGVEVRNPAITNEYNNSLPNSNVQVGDNETAVINGIRRSISVDRGGFVKGAGTVVDLVLNYGSTVSPGNSPGKLTVLDMLYFYTGSNYYAELQSTSAYDQLAVGEEYTSPSGYAVSLNSADLNVVLSDGFSMAQGDKFTIIDNKSSRPVYSTFKNLAEGTVFSVADGTFSISYVGGDGNDVVLTVVSAPSKPAKAPNTGFKVLSSNPLLILGLGIITAGFFLALSSRRLSVNR